MSNYNIPTAILDKIAIHLVPITKNNGTVNLHTLPKKTHLAHALATMLNHLFASSTNTTSRQFIADDILPQQILVNKGKLYYWGTINWLTIPKQHTCFKGYQDPFYAVFTIQNNQLTLTEAMFGSDNKIDLDYNNWMALDVLWMYTF